MEQRWPEIDLEIYEGNYIAVSKNKHFAIVINDLFPVEGEDYTSWAYSLDNMEIEGAIQMYYDLWNFGNGSRFYKEMVDCLVTERTRRLQK